MRCSVGVGNLYCHGIIHYSNVAKFEIYFCREIIHRFSVREPATFYNSTFPNKWYAREKNE